MPRTSTPPSEPPWLPILEDIRSQSRAVLEAVRSFAVRYERGRVEDCAHMGSRFDVVEGILREHSRDFRAIKADLSEIKTTLRRVDGKADHLSALEPRVAALERSGD